MASSKIARPSNAAVSGKPQAPPPSRYPSIGAVDLRDDSAEMRKDAARHAVAHLIRSIEQAVRSAGVAYTFSANSYTAETLSDVNALPNLAEIVAAYISRNNS
jgi:hypothetical protein